VTGRGSGRLLQAAAKSSLFWEFLVIYEAAHWAAYRNHYCSMMRYCSSMHNKQRLNRSAADSVRPFRGSPLDPNPRNAPIPRFQLVLANGDDLWQFRVWSRRHSAAGGRTPRASLGADTCWDPLRLVGRDARATPPCRGRRQMRSPTSSPVASHRRCSVSGVVFFFPSLPGHYLVGALMTSRSCPRARSQGRQAARKEPTEIRETRREGDVLLS
jgi:hypothetical protein